MRNLTPFFVLSLLIPGTAALAIDSISVKELKSYDMAYTGDISHIIGDKDTTDGDMKHLLPLCRAGKVKSIRIVFGQMNGTGLRELVEKCGTWDSVVSLDLAGNPLTEENLAFLGAFPKLETLNIDHDREGESPIHGDFLKSIDLPRLKHIWAKGTKFTDENAHLILKMPSLEVFNFDGVGLSEATMNALEREKINMSKYPWDLRRVRWEANRNQICNSPYSNSEVDEEIAEATRLLLIKEEASPFLKANGLVPAVIIEDEDEEPWLYGICKNIPVELDEAKSEL